MFHNVSISQASFPHNNREAICKHLISNYYFNCFIIAYVLRSKKLEISNIFKPNFRMNNAICSIMCKTRV